MGTPKQARYTRRSLLKGAGVTAAVATTGLQAGTPQRMSAARAPVVRLGPRPGAPGSVLVELTVNEIRYELPTDPRWTLADVLRDEIGLTGTKVGCDRAECGTCTVLLDGRPVLACTTLAAQASGGRIVTIEGLSRNGQLHPLQQAFLDNHGLACGFCTPGMVLSAKALLDRNKHPTRDEIRAALAGNLCRCTGYQKILDSVEAAAKLL